MLNMANSADPDEMPRFAVSNLGLRYFQMPPFRLFCIHVFTMSSKLRTLNCRQATSLHSLTNGDIVRMCGLV